MLYNTRLRLFPGKLKFRWSDPFIVNKVFVNGAIKIHDTKDYYTFTMKNQRLKIYIEGEVPVDKVSLILINP